MPAPKRPEHPTNVPGTGFAFLLHRVRQRDGLMELFQPPLPLPTLLSPINATLQLPGRCPLVPKVPHGANPTPCTPCWRSPPWLRPPAGFFLLLYAPRKLLEVLS